MQRHVPGRPDVVVGERCFADEACLRRIELDTGQIRDLLRLHLAAGLGTLVQAE